MDPNYDPTDLAGQADLRKTEANRARLVRETELGDLKWQMSSKRGRRIICRLLDESGIHRSTFDRDSHQTAFNEGWRNFGNSLLVKLDAACPDLYLTMLKEHFDARTNGDGNGSSS